VHELRRGLQRSQHNPPTPEGLFGGHSAEIIAGNARDFQSKSVIQIITEEPEDIFRTR
jgi:hypothetical protein